MSGKDVRAVIVMGVSGAGKSSVAELLAKNLGSAFVEGDSLHPKANIDKMAHGIPLTDEDRWPWLDVIGKEIAGLTDQGKSVVATCSSLKRAYRDRLRKAAGGKLYFVFLKGAEDLLSRRMSERKGHFMPAALLQSQLAALESPEGEEGVVTVDIDASIETIVENARSGLDQIMAQ